MAGNLKWFSARCVFEHLRDGRTLYEERIVLVQATDLDEAILLGEKEAVQYARDNQCTYLEYVDVYLLPAGPITHGSELYSMMRESDLDSEEYISTFFDTGKERVSRSDDQKYEGAYLFDVAVGVEPMTRTLANNLLHLWEVSDQSYEDYLHKITDSTLGKVEAYQLGKALVEKAKDFLKEA